MHNWQSIDFRESMNALLCQKLLGLANDFSLPEMIWQDNTCPQNWQERKVFGTSTIKELDLGQELLLIDNHYGEDEFKAYGKDFRAFKAALFKGKANQALVDILLEEDLPINGEIVLQLKVKSSENKGLLSAQILDYGKKKTLGRSSYCSHPIKY